MAFTKALSDEFGKLKSKGAVLSAADYANAERRVFDRWIAEGRQEGLVRYLVESYDGMQGGEDWMRLLARNLVDIKRPELIQKLYKPVIQRRCRYYFQRLALLRWPVPDFIDRIFAFISPPRRKLAGDKTSIIKLMEDYRATAVKCGSIGLSEIDHQIATLSSDHKTIQPTITLAASQMDEEAFWNLIDRIRARHDTENEIIAVVEASLQAIKPTMIDAFQKILFRLLDQAYRWDLWAVAYAVRQG